MAQPHTGSTTDSQSSPLDSNKQWFSSPGLVAIFGSPIVLALFGLLAGVIKLVLQNNEALQLEQRKYEYSVIQAALQTQYIDDAVGKLEFFKKAGLLKTIDEQTLNHLIETHQLPIFAGEAIKYHLVSVTEAKQLLASLKVYDGPFNNEIDEKFFRAVADFQYKYNTNTFAVKPGDNKEDKLDVDGLLGPKTYSILRQVLANNSK